MEQFFGEGSHRQYYMQVLGLSENWSGKDLKKAFIEHARSSLECGDVGRFTEVTKAYKALSLDTFLVKDSPAGCHYYYYNILNLPTDACEAEIRATCDKLLTTKEYYVRDDVIKAKELLLDPEKRYRYDQTGNIGEFHPRYETYFVTDNNNCERTCPTQ